MLIRMAPDRGTISKSPSGRTMMLVLDMRPSRHRTIGVNFDRALVFPGSIQRLGDENIARPGFADDNGITAVGKNERGYVVAFAALVVGPAEALST